MLLGQFRSVLILLKATCPNLSLYNSLLGPGRNTPSLNLCTLGFAQYKPSLYFCPLGANQYNLCCFSLIACHWRLMLTSLYISGFLGVVWGLTCVF